ncbi:hypothetical protein K1719_027149 [Acacia pycnantha]|nr:hypothetical protein K1719_027149 [Acacia pycnantha]
MMLDLEPVSKSCKSHEEEEGDKRPQLLQCAELFLPWLTPLELANVSLTCKAFSLISKTVILRRVSDSSRGFENWPIPFCNTVDDTPYALFAYTPSLILPSDSQYLRQSWGSNFAATHDGVGDEENRCPCSNLAGLDVANECGLSCKCGLQCGNRLSQKGISVRLKIVKDRRKGWGLYSDQLIQKGQFVCEYAGELLTTKEARRRHLCYDELSSQGKFSSALLVVKEHLPSGRACLRMNIDATRIGNVARFINHSCDGGNLTTKLVRRSGALFPRLCFFALEDIERDEELTFSYGEIRTRPMGLPCFCGSSSCFGTLPSEDT